MKYLEDSRLTQLTSDLTGAILNTRGSGSSGGCSSSMVADLLRSNNGNNSSNGRNKKGGKSKKQNKQQKQQPGGGSGGSSSTPRKSAVRSPPPPPPAYLTYNPEGYGSSAGATGSSSCRVIYGRVEAYTTKRTGSDKKTISEVGERYAHEMERLNEAVEALKRRHKEENGLLLDGKHTSASAKGNSNGGSQVNTKKMERRRRSRSVDGVTFATSPSVSSTMVYDKSENTVDMMDTLKEGTVFDGKKSGNNLEHGKEVDSAHGHASKRVHPLEGILKQPSSSNKRCRATSFDVSTGPSTSRYHHSESSSSLLAGSSWGNALRSSSGSNNGVVTSGGISFEEDVNIHPLIPQPSLYQSSLGEGSHHADKGGGKTPTMAPRRLVTDLILTLNTSFPDYDFSSAQVSDFCTLSSSEAMRRINERLAEYAATTDEGRDFLPRFWNALDDVLGRGLNDCEVYSYAPKGSTGDDDPLEFLTMSMTENGTGSGGSAEESMNGGAGSDGIIGILAEPIAANTVMYTPSGGGRIVSGDSICLDEPSSMALNLPNQISPASYSDPPHVTLWSMNYFFVSRNKKRIVLFACVQTMRTPQGNDDDDAPSDEYEYGENDLVFDEARRSIGEDQDNSCEYTYPLPHRSDDIGNEGKEFPMSGGDGESVMVEDTDVDEGVDVDGEDEEQGEKDFDTGVLELSVAVPSQVA